MFRLQWKVLRNEYNSIKPYNDELIKIIDVLLNYYLALPERHFYQ